jgi:hypothetical protein
MIPFKQWCMEEAIRGGVALNTVYNRVLRGCYPGLKVRRVNKRVVYVVQPALFVSGRKLPQPGEMRLTHWVADEAARLGLSIRSAWWRVQRGDYPELQLRREGRFIFVRICVGGLRRVAKGCSRSARASREQVLD